MIKRFSISLIPKELGQNPFWRLEVLCKTNLLGLFVMYIFVVKNYTKCLIF